MGGSPLACRLSLVLWGAWLLFPPGSTRAQDLPPPLEAPSVAPSADEAPDATPPPESLPSAQPPPPPRPETRPLLVIPGVTAPTANQRGSSNPQGQRTTSAPALIAPESSARTGRSAGSATVMSPAVPLSLEPIPEDESDEVDLVLPRANDGSRRPAPPAASSPSRSPATTQPRPRSTAPDRGLNTGRNQSLGTFGPVTKPKRDNHDELETQPDPAVEAAVKRKIQRQVQQAVGDRAQNVEVRLDGKTVLIRAKANRFWQRWGVRRTLENLPMPAGYRPRVEMVN